MAAGLSLAIALLAQAAAAPPATAQPPADAPPAAPAPAKKKRCNSGDGEEIIVCGTPRGNYRIDPDVLEASRGMRRGGRLKRPETMRDNTCAIGPQGCVGAIDLIGAAVAGIGMAVSAVRGENVGKKFITDPQPDEYQLYLEAKRRREAEEAARLAKEAEAAAAPEPAAPR